MAGSPKKRARRLAREEAEREAAAQAATNKSVTAATSDEQAPPSVPVVVGEILPPVSTEPTRTALKRAMRARAQEHAEKAIAVLVAALESPDEKVRLDAANKLLDRGFGKPEKEIEAGDGAQMIVIRRFGEQV